MNVFKTLALMMVFSIILFLLVGCSTASTPLKDAIGKELNIGDVKIAGEALGEGGYYAFKFIEGDEKYTKYTERIKQINKAIEDAQKTGNTEGLDVNDLTNAALDVLTVVAAAEVGPQNAALIRMASNIALRYVILFARSRLPEDQLEVFINAVWTGVQRAKANGADLISQPTAIDALVALEPSEECGITCVIDKIRSRLNEGGLSDYDKKRLKARLKKLEKQYEKEMSEIEAEIGFCGEAAD